MLFVLERDVRKDMFARNVVENVLNNSRYQVFIKKARSKCNEKAVSKQQKCILSSIFTVSVITVGWNVLSWM